MSVIKIFPRDSGELIAKGAKSVSVLEDGVKTIASEIVKKLQDGSLSINNFSQHHLHPEPTIEALDWLFVVDTLNFCFWTATGSQKWTVTYKDKKYTGYFALCAALNRAVDEGYSITNPKYYSQLKLKDLKQILRGDDENVEVPLLQERLDCLHEVGSALLENFSGTFAECIIAAEKSAESLLNIIIENFKCFRDETSFNNTHVTIYKRAQILIGDIWACFKGRDWGYFPDINILTMFADYRVPQVLIHFKAMKYTDELLAKLKEDTPLEYGSEEEVEIRGCSIHVVELINEEIKKQLPDVVSVPTEKENEIICNSVVIDHFLWDYRREYADELEIIPFHKTKSIYY